MSEDRILIVGASGHASVVLDIAEKTGRVVVGFAARDAASSFCGYPVLGSDEDVRTLYEGWTSVALLVAIGDNFQRGEVVQRIRSDVTNPRFATLIHPSSQIGRGVEIGAGTVIMAGVAVNTNAVIGEHVILNTRCSVDHDCVVADFASLAPGATLGGRVTVGSYAAISLGANVIHRRVVGEHALVGAGATVVKDVPAHTVVVGTPARVTRQREPGEPYL